MAESKLEVIQYLVDTRGLWPAATKTSDLETEVNPRCILAPQLARRY
jgi:4'-phosphopantetheinyl transferase